MAEQLELYVHIPFCVKKCEYCDFLSFPTDQSTKEAYIRALCDEIRFFGKAFADREISTVYIGGGTPSSLSKELSAKLLDTIGESFSVRRDVEASIECNPGTLTEGKLLTYKAAGMNRISLGLQSADEGELKLLGRVHTFEDFLRSYDLARKTGFDNINVDVMSGLPMQSLESYYQTLQKVIRLRPEHISAYSLIIEKGTPFYDKYKFDAVKQEAGIPTEFLPSEDDAYRMTKLTQRVLAEARYGQYEISNYAKEGFACRHNIGYWQRKNYLGVGLGAASLLDNVRYSNTRDLGEYLKQAARLHSLKPTELSQRPDFDAESAHRLHKYSGSWFGTNLHCEANPISRKAQMEEFMFLGLRMVNGVKRADFEAAFSLPIEAIYRRELENLQKEQLLEIHGGEIYLTDRGMDLSNYAMAKFLL